jgi:hypothetical protein
MVEVVWRLPLIRLAAVVERRGNRSLYSQPGIVFSATGECSFDEIQPKTESAIKTMGGGQPGTSEPLTTVPLTSDPLTSEPRHFLHSCGNKCMSQEISGQKMRREILSLGGGPRILLRCGKHGSAATRQWCYQGSSVWMDLEMHPSGLVRSASRGPRACCVAEPSAGCTKSGAKEQE